MEALYEVEAYQSTFKEADVANKWLEAKRKLLEDAGLTVVQYSMIEIQPGHINVNIQAHRGEKPGKEPMH
jgi:hypothetical protein